MSSDTEEESDYNYFVLNPALTNSLQMIRSDVGIPNVRSNSENEETPADRRIQLISAIQNMVLTTVSDIVNHVEPKLKLPHRPKWAYCDFTDRLVQKLEGEYPLQEITLRRNLPRFNVIFSLMAKLYHLLQADDTASRRELYYENTQLFGSQKKLENAVFDLCYLIECKPWEMPLYGSSKGLVAGDVKITTASHDVLNCCIRGGMLVPENVPGIVKIESTARYILIVEKDAVFQRLLDWGIIQKMGPCILVTGKGEPDINTRLLVHRLFTDLLIPVFALVDGNPYGIEIMCTYRFGSLSLSKYAQDLAVPQIRWIGVHPTDIARLSMPSAPMTRRDHAKALDLGGRAYIQKDENLLEQVNCLIMTSRKCEIEDLSSISPTFLLDMYLPSKMQSRSII